jgi:hypothetical protein
MHMSSSHLQYSVQQKLYLHHIHCNTLCICLVVVTYSVQQKLYLHHTYCHMHMSIATYSVLQNLYLRHVYCHLQCICPVVTYSVQQNLYLRYTYYHTHMSSSHLQCAPEFIPSLHILPYAYVQ